MQTNPVRFCVVMTAALTTFLFLIAAVAVVPTKAQAHPARGEPGFQMITIDGRGIVGLNNDIATDSRDHPHMVYTASEIDKVIRYAQWNGVYWVFETLPFAVSPGETGLALALDSTDAPLLAYQDLTAHSLYYSTKVAGEWQREKVADLASAAKVELQLAPDGTPWLAWYEESTKGVYVSNRTNGTWNTYYVARTEDYHKQVALAIDPNGVPAVAYYDSVQDRIMYARLSNGQWQSEAVAPAGPDGGFPALAFNAEGVPHLLYSHYEGTDWDLFYTTKANGAWTESERISFQPNDTSIVIAADGTIHATYVTTSGYLYHAAKRGSGGWTLSALDTNSDYGIHPSLAVDSNGRAHTIYHHLDYRDLRYSAMIPEWETVTVATNLSSVANFDMMENGVGSPNFLYNDSGRATFGTWDGTAWQADPLTTAPTDPRFVSLQYDMDGIAHVALYEDNRLVYGVRDGTTWVWTTVDDNGAGEYPTLILARSRTPVISYWDSTNYRVKVAVLTEGGWKISSHTGSPELNEASGYPHGDISTEGTIWISYYDAIDTDMRLAEATYDAGEGTWTWQDRLIGVTEGDSGPANDLVSSQGFITPTLVYEYRDELGDMSLEMASRTSADTWPTEQIQDLYGEEDVPALALDLRAGNTNTPRVAYFVKSPLNANPTLWYMWHNGYQWDSTSPNAVHVDLEYPVPPVISSDRQDRIAYMDGTTLKMITRTTIGRLPYLPSTTNTSTGGDDLGMCECVLTQCPPWTHATASSLAGGSEEVVDDDILLRRLTPLFSQTEAGQYYVDQYKLHGMEFYGILTSHPTLSWTSFSTLQDFMPGLEALVTGRGNEVYITSTQVANAYNVWHDVAAYASPDLKTTINAELAKSDNLQDYVGMTFNEWAIAIGAVPPASSSPMLYLPLVGR